MLLQRNSKASATRETRINERISLQDNMLECVGEYHCCCDATYQGETVSRTHQNRAMTARAPGAAIHAPRRRPKGRRRAAVPAASSAGGSVHTAAGRADDDLTGFRTCQGIQEHDVDHIHRQTTRRHPVTRGDLLIQYDIADSRHTHLR